MNDCGRLFHAENIKAFYSTAHKALVLSAEVTINPYSDSVRICRNPLERLLPAPEVHEYIVVGTTRPGIHPDLVVNRTISASFPMDATPAKVAVYSMGIDNPERVEVSVGTEVPVVSTEPPQTSPSAQASTAPQSAPTTGAAVEATGWSSDFVLQDALSTRWRSCVPPRVFATQTSVCTSRWSRSVGRLAASHCTRGCSSR